MNFWSDYCNKLGRNLGGAVDLLIPSPCLLCAGDSRAALCEPCKADYPDALTPRCRQCANRMPETGNETICSRCLDDPPAFDCTVVVCDYAAPLDQVVLALKFGQQPVLARWIAQRLLNSILANRQLALPDLLCAVPLSPQRLQQRGYNQAHEIARYLAPMLGLPLLNHGLSRTRNTEAQSQLSLADRKNNLLNAFQLSPELIRQLPGSHIGITDDVITTGMTLHEVATILKKYGAERITNYVFARTPDPAHTGEE